MQLDFVQKIDACLPQTQCTRCGYPRCRDYAQALADNTTDLNRCPPGGDDTITALATLLDKPERPLDPETGTHEPPLVAVIRESECIGCTLCIAACPVDAIAGSGKLMHAVITDECTGCELCLPPCPMDCIDLVPANRPAATDSLWAEYDAERVSRARRRIEYRTQRQLNEKPEFDPAPPTEHERETMRTEIERAVARGRAARENKKNGKGATRMVTFGDPS